MEAEQASRGPTPVACTVYPAAPAALSQRTGQDCLASNDGRTATLGNGFLLAEIAADTGVISAVTNRLTGQRHVLNGDQVCVAFMAGGAEPRTWTADMRHRRPFSVELDNQPGHSRVRFAAKEADFAVSVEYELRSEWFSLQRRLVVDGLPAHTRFDRLVYGKLHVAQADVRVLELGKFDRPRIARLGRGGLFGGVAWWFYNVGEDGAYQNEGMDYATEGRFESEPWYVGVLEQEAGEPFAGWLWYKTFLEQRKSAHDKQKAWTYWNAGWGQWGIDIDDPSAPPYIELAHRLGVRSIAFGSGGSGKGIPQYTRLAREDKVAQDNLKLLKRHNIGVGFLNSGGLGAKWADSELANQRSKELEAHAAAGYDATHFDFLSTVDTFTAHRNVAQYFRAARERLAYTECHLGMAAYGPQMQREVLINHPADIGGFDISRFSPDWTTFLAFRQSRAAWLDRWQRLAPECGLYYFLTHYANWGNPRRYVDPEPQQFLYRPHAYCGIGYDFHDTVGFRDALAAASAFSPYYVFGHLDLKMPQRDVEFARRFQQWVDENASLLRLGRVCSEDGQTCVVSKVCDGKGAIFLLNYQPGERVFSLKLAIGGAGPATIRRVYPDRGAPMATQDGWTVEARVGGESVVILELNRAMKNLPPENRRRFPVEIADWKASGARREGIFLMPDVKALLAKHTDPSLPARLLSLEQAAQTRPDLVAMVRVRPGEEPRSLVQWLGRGPLPEPFLAAYGFDAAHATVETWKVVPWAYADRVWVVYRPEKPIPLSAKPPRLTLNGQAVALWPRVDYRPKNVAAWTCPLLFADITGQVRYGAPNAAALDGAPETTPACYVTSGVGQD